LVLDFKIREVFLADIRDVSQFNVLPLRKFLCGCKRIEFGSVGSYFGSLSVFGDVVSARTAKLLRTAEDHEPSLFFALSGIVESISQIKPPKQFSKSIQNQHEDGDGTGVPIVTDG
jgi:hypothetical protein